jgi:hypothetical protein
MRKLASLFLLVGCSAGQSTLSGHVAATHSQALVAVATSRSGQVASAVDAKGNFTMLLSADSAYLLRFIAATNGQQVVVGTAASRLTLRPLTIHFGARRSVDLGDVGDQDQDLDGQGSGCTGAGVALPVQNDDDDAQGDNNNQGEDDQGSCDGGSGNDDDNAQGDNNNQGEDGSSGGMCMSACVPGGGMPGAGGTGGGSAGSGGGSASSGGTGGGSIGSGGTGGGSTGSGGTGGGSAGSTGGGIN